MHSEVRCVVSHETQESDFAFSAPHAMTRSLLTSIAAGLISPGLHAEPLQLDIERGVDLSWPTAAGNNYQLQWAPSASGPWNDKGSLVVGTGDSVNRFEGSDTLQYRVLEILPAPDPVAEIPVNGGFESGEDSTAEKWQTGGNQPPLRSANEARTGSFSMRCFLANIGTTPAEGTLNHRVASSGGTVEGGASYDFSFHAKQISTGPSYLQQYQLQWLDSNGDTLGGSGLVSFTGESGVWQEISLPDRVAPAAAVDARVSFRFVTGAVEGGHGEVFIDDVQLHSRNEPAAPGETHILPVTQEPVSRLRWPTRPGTSYQPTSSIDLTEWNPIDPPIRGNGSPAEIVVPRESDTEFFRLLYPDPPDIPDGEFVDLFNEQTTLEPAISIDTAEALITHVGDRARDRHAREDMFQAYDHYLTWYWEERTLALEIVDLVAKGGTGITFNYTTLTPLGAAEFRAFFRGLGTVAEYHHNAIAPLVGPNQYSATITHQLPENRPLQIGDRIEIEISQFLEAPTHGRSNYYGTAILYIVGQGIVPWQASGPVQDSFPLPETAWLGGKTTLPYQYSDEPDNRFKQTAGNISPLNIQPFMLGRRLHHTDFGNGSHSEPGNPTFSEHSGKLGPRFIGRSCVECHTNNGRALPPEIGAPMLMSVMKVGTDTAGAPHPTLGSVLQPLTISGEPEASASIGSYTTVEGQYADGTPYTLHKPNYVFDGVTPDFFSNRLAPPLVGMGLLEAISESSILALADPEDSDADGISGRPQIVMDPETGEPRIGRFTAKGGQARLRHQIASALSTDMGISTSVFPQPEDHPSGGPIELGDDELDKMTRYVALLGVGARRDLEDASTLTGEQIFSSAGCVKCHTAELTTSPFHPMAELRDQTIHPFTDLLLHDMGAGLADNMGEHDASGSEWRTTPLWGIGLTAGVSGGEAYLHDGRASTLEEAILWHGGEGETAKENFRNLSQADRDALIAFLKSL